MIPQDTVKKILDSAEIVDVVSDFVSLKRRGANYIACCPFHNEKTPSFSVSPSKGIYHCFGCGKTGSAVGFVMEHESLSYPDALKYLARKYGIEIREEEETPEAIAARQRSESLYLVMDFAEQFFKDSLRSDEGRAIGYAYFRSRGLEDATIEKYGLGWSPKDGRSLSNLALAKGYKAEYLTATGVSIRRNDGSLIDKFSDRVMFPIHSVTGRVIAFGGRTLRSDYKTANIGKYVNSPETEIYDKSNSLYGLYFAKSEISRQDKCYLVEGYLDVLSMHQLGITNVVASSGTSLTVPQIRLIKKFTDNITIMYDGDAAGIHAALRGIGLILKEGLNVRVVLIPDGDDPDSYSKKHSLAEVQSFIAANERDFIGFKTDLLLQQAGNDPLKRAEIINDIASTIALIPDQIKRAVYVQTAAGKFDVDEQIIYNRVTEAIREALDAQRKEEMRQQFREERAAQQTSASLGPEVVPGAADVPSDVQSDTFSDAGRIVPGNGGPAEVAVVTPANRKAANALHFENPVTAPSEKDLLTFILRHGLKLLDFESDSEFYDNGEQVTVADFIRDAIEDHPFSNSIYSKTYDAYFSIYDSDSSLTDEDNSEIILRLMNSQDRDVAAVTSALVVDRYQLTVKNFEKSMTTVSSSLVQNVPKAILVYNSALVKSQEHELYSRIKELSRNFTGGEDQQEEMEELLRKQQKLLDLRKRIMNKLGRVQ